MSAPKRILHLHSSFDLGGKEARAVRLMNAMGGHAHHVVLSAVPDAMGAKSAIAPGIQVDFPGSAAPALHGKPSPGRYWRLARYMRAFDLLLTYNWGSMDGVMAHRVFAPFIALPPLIHHEDGFNEDERERRNKKRDMFRRLALPTAKAVMVPSETLRTIARDGWGCAESQIVKFDNGIALSDYSQSSARPPFAKASSDIWVGTIAGLRAVKNLPALVRAVAMTGNPNVHLVIAGEGPERAAIEAEAEKQGIAERLHMLGFHPRPAEIAPFFDIFGLSSFSEQQPISLIEAMAAGVPAACYDVGDIAHMVAPENARFLAPPGDEAALSCAIATLADDAAKRAETGAANRDMATRRFDERVMIDHFLQIYGKAMRDTGFCATIGA